jgi:predicted hotdog family 3-hydroxylacyl-ACP dehydratase
VNLQQQQNTFNRFNHLMTVHSVLEYIPQRPPFVMVDELVFCNSEQTQTIFTVKENHLFVSKGKFTEMGILENIAQTCAARLGYLNRMFPVRIGMIGSADNFEIQSLPLVGDQITTTITIMTEVLNVILLSATVLCGELAVASSNMKVVLTDMINE